MKYGYARVSTNKQNLDYQLDILKNNGCDIIITEKRSAGDKQKELYKLIDDTKEGDLLVVVKLDRLCRSRFSLSNIINKLQNKKVSLVSLKENINTDSMFGKLFIDILMILAEFERDNIRENTKRGLDAARIRGRIGGRPRVSSKNDIEEIRELYNSKKFRIEDICSKFKISKTTLYRNLKLF